MRKLTFFLIISLLLMGSEVAQATMTSTNYEIRWDTLGSGGEDTSSSTTYKLRDTIGNTAIGVGTSTTYNLRAGYRQGVVDQTMVFAIYPQVNSSQVAATSLSGSTVTVSSSSGYTSGDYILVVQDEGASQVTGFGKITSLTGSTLTVDSLSDNGTAPVIDGSNDYVYKMSGSSLSLGTLSATLVTTRSIGWNVSVESDNGYNVQVYDDGNLRTATDDIADVTDGSVTAGSEEYGARSSDSSIASSTFDTADSAVTTSPQVVADRSSKSYNERDHLTFKAAISSASESGSYSQSVTFIATGNF